MKHKQISVLRHLEHFYIYIITLIISLLFILQTDNEIIKYYFIGIAVIVGLLTITIHLQYYLNDRNTQLEINLADEKLIYQNGTLILIVHFNDILQIDRYVSHNSAENRTRLPTDPYSYVKIKLIDNREIIITSLIMNSWETLVGLDRSIQLHKKFFAKIK